MSQPTKAQIDALISELGKAKIIIHVMLNITSLEQKMKVAAQLEAFGVSPVGMARAHERRTALAAVSE